VCWGGIGAGCHSFRECSKFPSSSQASGFAFRTLEEVGRFVVWLLSQQEEFRPVAEETRQQPQLTLTDDG
jgi:hypothetical protein